MRGVRGERYSFFFLGLGDILFGRRKGGRGGCLVGGLERGREHEKGREIELQTESEGHDLLPPRFGLRGFIAPTRKTNTRSFFFFMTAFRPTRTLGLF